MPSACAVVLRLSASERNRLKTCSSSPSLPHRLVIRAKIVRMAAAGLPNAVIASRLGLKVDTVRKWRGRFATDRLDGLRDRPRSGRPPHFTPVQRAEVKAMACQLPATYGIPLSRWSCPELAVEVVAAGIAPAMSPSTVRRILAHDAIKPWQYRSWISIRDPDFAAKANRVLDLYARIWDGQPLGEDEYVISSDEKTSIQARCRCHPTLAPGIARMMRVEHDYDRGGAVAYLAAYDVHRAHLMGRSEPRTGITPYEALVEQVMGQEPYASAKRVFWVVDNGSSHRGRAAVERMADRWPTCVLVHTPVHASWLNQIEIVFSVVQRKVVTPNDFHDLAEIEARLSAFEIRYNNAANPIDWKFTATDLNDLLARIDDHERSATPSAA